MVEMSDRPQSPTGTRQHRMGVLVATSSEDLSKFQGYSSIMLETSAMEIAVVHSCHPPNNAVPKYFTIPQPELAGLGFQIVLARASARGSWRFDKTDEKLDWSSLQTWSTLNSKRLLLGAPLDSFKSAGVRGDLRAYGSTSLDTSIHNINQYCEHL